MKRTGAFVIAFGLLLILGAVALTAFNVWDSNRAAAAADEIVASLETIIPKQRTTPTPEINAGEKEPFNPAASDDETVVEADETVTMPTVEVDGYGYIGMLYIPSLNLTLPVMDQWDYDRLEISPCWYAGSYLEDNLVICGHNYIGVFNDVRRIGLGESVYFINVDGVIYAYTVVNVETLEATAIEEMVGSDDHDWDLTLFTCNTGGQTRCAVRCARADGSA